MIKDRGLINDDGVRKVVTLLHYNFMAVDNKEDNNIIENMKGIKAMFGRPKKKRK